MPTSWCDAEESWSHLCLDILQAGLLRFGVCNAVLPDRSLPEAIEVVAGLELNSGGFLGLAVRR